jgi:hypothetical protein
LIQQRAENKEFQKELSAAAAGYGFNKEEFFQVYQALIKKYVPEEETIQKSIDAFYVKCNELSGINSTNNTAKLREEMSKDFLALFLKHKETQQAFALVTNSPEYQHKAQLITEKFQNNQQSAEFIKEMQELMYEFCPGMKILQEEMAIITKKYPSA